MLKLLRRLGYWVRRRRAEADLAEEMEMHRALTQEHLERDGLPARDAALVSRRAMGNITLAREDAAATWIWPWVQGLRQDGVYAIRTMWRQPGFTLVAVMTLAAGIGLNTAVFNVYAAIAMRPWPVRDANRIVTIYNRSGRDLRARAGGGPWGFSVAEMKYFLEHSKTFSGFIAIRSGGGDRTLGEEDTPASWVSASYFSVLGIDMAAGRGFTADEDRVESPVPVAVLSHAYWQRRFGGDPALAGKPILLEGVPFTVVGIAPQAFTGTSPDRVDVWMPIASASLLRPDDRWVRNVAQKPESCCLNLAGRLAPGVTREQALAELIVLDRQFRAGRDPDAGSIHFDGTQVNAGPRGGGSPFTAVFAGVILVLLLACANVGNLLVARAAARRREIAVRLALGASRGRIVRQLLTESLALALLAGAVGLFSAGWLVQIVVNLIAGPTALRLEADTGVLGFALAASLVSCLLFGLAPALHGTRTGVGSALKSTVPMAGSRMPLRNLLLTIQVAVAVVLLASAGLLTRAVHDASVRDMGFSMRDLSVVSFETPPRGYDARRTQAVSLQLASVLEGVGGPGGLALTSTEPLGSGNIKGSFRLPGGTEDQNNSVYEVSPAYFELLELEMLAGRRLDGSDANKPVIVISQTMARRYWTTASAVGQRILVDPATGGWNTPGELEIVGVVEDVHQTGFEEPDSTIYQPLSGRVLPRVLVRTTSAGMTATIAAGAARIDPGLRARARPIADNLTPRLSSSRIGAFIAWALGGLALTLASVGVLGVFSYWVQQRTREIGIHMALGARAPQVVRLLLGSTARSLLAGAACGIAGSLAASQLLRRYLFGLSPFDPVAYGAVIVLLALAACAATYWPARRATRVNPVVALRCE